MLNIDFHWSYQSTPESSTNFIWDLHKLTIPQNRNHQYLWYCGANYWYMPLSNTPTIITKFNSKGMKEKLPWNLTNCNPLEFCQTTMIRLSSLRFIIRAAIKTSAVEPALLRLFFLRSWTGREVLWLVSWIGILAVTDSTTHAIAYCCTMRQHYGDKNHSSW